MYRVNPTMIEGQTAFVFDVVLVENGYNVGRVARFDTHFEAVSFATEMNGVA